MSIEPFRAVRGIGTAASVLIGLCAVAAVADAFVAQYSANVVSAYADGSATMEDLRAVDSLALAVAAPSLLVWIAAGITFIGWLVRSRRNAERVTHGSEHRHKRGWVIGAWFVPILNLWYPLQIVHDIWRAVDPAQQNRPLQKRDENGFVTAWWVVFLLNSFGDQAVTRLFLSDADPATVATWTWVNTVVTIVAAVLAIVLIRRLNDMQDGTSLVRGKVA